MTVAFYNDAHFDQYQTAPRAYPPHVEQAVQELNKACKGLGTDEKALIHALTSVNDVDRVLIIRRYKEVFGTELKDLVKGETSGNFGFAVRLLAMPLPEMEAFVVRTACHGAGTNEKLLFPVSVCDVWLTSHTYSLGGVCLRNFILQVVIGRTAAEMNLLKRTYFDKHNADLGVVMNSELGGDFKKVVMAAVQAQLPDFDPAFHTAARAEEDAEKLYKAGEGKWGTDEDTFVKVLFMSPPKYLEMVNAWYLKKHNNSIRVAVEKEFGGDAEKALLYFGMMIVPLLVDVCRCQS